MDADLLDSDQASRLDDVGVNVGDRIPLAQSDPGCVLLSQAREAIGPARR